MTPRFPLPLISVAVLAALAVPSPARVWTDVDGRKIDAELLDFNKEGVSLKLANGKTAKVAFDRLSPDDKKYLVEEAIKGRKGGGGAPIAGPVAKCAGFDAHWPSAAQCSLDLKIDTVSEDKGAGKFVYHSAHYEFVSNAQLRPKVVGAFATLFEATHEMVRVLPLNNRLTAVPTKLRVFLYDTVEGYNAAGGPRGSAGVCMGSGVHARIAVPLESLGVKKVPGKDEFIVDPKQTNQVLAHEITHALMENEVKMASWYIEGSAEYVAATPFTAGRYRITENRSAIVKSVTAFGKAKDGGRNLGKDITIPPLERFMSQPYPEFVSNPHFNYGMATLLTYYFYHLDGRGDAARVKAYVKALQDATPETEARARLLDGRTWPQLESEFAAGMKKLGVHITFPH